MLEAEPQIRQAVEALLAEAEAARSDGDFTRMRRAADGAVRAGQYSTDPVLLVRALAMLSDSSRMLYEYAESMRCSAEILAVAARPEHEHRFEETQAVRAVRYAYRDFADSAMRLDTASGSLEGVEAVLDEGERWLASRRPEEWRAPLMYLRAEAMRRRGALAEALACAQEAAGLAERSTEPGFTLSSYDGSVGDLLRRSGRLDEARAAFARSLERATSVNDRHIAENGLAWCALNAGEADAALRHAMTDTELAAGVSVGACCGAWEARVEALRRKGDLNDAWDAANERLGYAAQLGGSLLGWARSSAADLALDRKDRTAGQHQLAELERMIAAEEVPDAEFRQTVDRLRRRMVEQAPPTVYRRPHLRGWLVLAAYRLLLCGAAGVTMVLMHNILVLFVALGYGIGAVSAALKRTPTEISMDWNGLQVRRQKISWSAVNRLAILRSPVRATVEIWYKASDGKQTHMVLPVPHRHLVAPQPDFDKQAEEIARYAEGNFQHVRVGRRRMWLITEVVSLLLGL